MTRPISDFKSHGTGQIERDKFCSLGRNVIFEAGVLVFHPEQIRIGNNVYVGHNTILKAYYKNEFSIGDNSWIGQQCFFHSAGGLQIGARVGIGPAVKILTSAHMDEGPEVPILFSELRMAQVVIEDDCDIGIGAIILPGVRIGRGTQVGAGSVVTRNIDPYSVVAGVPARVIRSRSRK